MSGRVSKAGLAGFAVTLALVIPLLFILSRNAVSADHLILIVCGVLALVLWTLVYVKLVDPFLRRGVGALLGVPIELQGGRQGSPAWAPGEPRGCLFEMFVGLAGFLFMFLWFAPLLGAVFYIMFFRH